MAQLKRKPKEIELLNDSVDSNTDIIKSNSQKEVLKAKKALEVAKEIEKSKKDHVWVTNGKTSILASPKRVAQYLIDGCKEMKVKLKKNCKNE